MDNQRTETSTRNAGISQKIGSFFFGILLGLALLALGFALLVWNELTDLTQAEQRKFKLLKAAVNSQPVLGCLFLFSKGHAVKAFKSLDEGLNIVISLTNIDVVNQENNGKLVHLIGSLSTDKALQYERYGVSVHAVKLKSVGEMYQWVEHEDKIIDIDDKSVLNARNSKPLRISYTSSATCGFCASWSENIWLTLQEDGKMRKRHEKSNSGSTDVLNIHPNTKCLASLLEDITGTFPIPPTEDMKYIDTITWTKEWRSEVINCSTFHETFNQKHVYPTLLPSHLQWTIEAFNVSVGQFRLSKGLISRISEFHPLPPSYLHPPQDSQVVLHDGAFYGKVHCSDPLHPEIGDLRARLEYAGISGESLLGSPAMVTIVAKQLRSELVPYKTLAGDELEMLYFGQLLPKEIFDMEIFKKEKNQNTRLTWAMRFGGGLLVFIGNALLSREGDWTPIASKFIVIKEKLMNLASIVCGHVYMGVNFLNLTAMILSISMSFYAVGMGIGGYRPLQGFCVLVIGQTPLILLIIATRKSWKPKHD